MKLHDFYHKEFSDYWLRLYYFVFYNVSAAVSSDLPNVSPVYLGIEMIQPGESFLKFDSWSTRSLRTMNIFRK